MRGISAPSQDRNISLQIKWFRPIICYCEVHEVGSEILSISRQLHSSALRILGPNNYPLDYISGEFWSHKLSYVDSFGVKISESNLVMGYTSKLMT